LEIYRAQVTNNEEVVKKHGHYSLLFVAFRIVKHLIHKLAGTQVDG
jgi:hypothetical protein